MLIPRILAAACVVTYLLAMCLPAVAAKGYHTIYLLHGWEVTYICGLFSFAPSMDLGDRAPIYRRNPFKSAIPLLHNIVSGTRILAPVLAALCGDLLDFRSVSCFLRGICFDRGHVAR